MQETLISFETAKLAKEKGFDWIVSDAYHKNTGELVFTDWENVESNDDILIPDDFNTDDESWLISAPTQSLLQKWLREVHNIIVEVVTYYNETDLPLNKPIKPKGYFAWDYYNENFSEEKAPKFKTYEQALEQGLQEALKLIEIVPMRTD